MLVRGMERRREISLRIALGAQALRLVRQALAESILLSLAGGVAGLVIAFAGTRLILHFAFPPTSGMAAIPIDASSSMPVLLFAFGVSLIAGVTFGIAPAWMTTRIDPIEALRGASRSTVRTGALPRKTLVVCQAALSLVLLAASGLLTAALRTSRIKTLASRRTGARSSGSIRVLSPIDQTNSPHFTGGSRIHYRAFSVCRTWPSASTRR